MATKKQKHAAGLAKRELLMKSLKESGLQALETDRKRQLEEEIEIGRIAETMKRRHAKALAKMNKPTSTEYLAGMSEEN